jgi:Tol biopolymer transport system component
MPSPTAEPFVVSDLASPDGEYIAYSYFYYGTEQQTMEIQDKEGKLIWQIPFQGELPHYDPRPIMSVYLWSNDSSQLYFCYSWSPDGGDVFIRYSCRDLQTIDIKTGEIQTVVSEGYTAFKISPNGSHIAYLQCDDETCAIHVRNLSTGSEKTASAITNIKDYIAEGGISWSPSGNGLVFHTQDADSTLQTIYLDVATMKLRLIKEYSVPLSRPEWAAFDGWVDDNTLIFVESGNMGEQVIYLNVRNNESIVIGTPTPRP